MNSATTYIYIYTHTVYLYNTYVVSAWALPGTSVRLFCLTQTDPDRPTSVWWSKKETAPHPKYFGPHHHLHQENRKPHAFDPHSTPLLIQSLLTQPRTPSSLPCFIHGYGHTNSSSCHHCFPNYSGHLNGSTGQIGSSARVCGTLGWIPVPMRSVWTPIGFHRPVITSTPTLKVIFTPKHHLLKRSPRSALQDVEIAFFFIFVYFVSPESP
jgi:hypothetical protein